MKKLNFLIFSLIFLGLTKDAALEESNLNGHLIGSLSASRTERNPRRLAQGRNSAAVINNIDDGFQDLTEVIESLEKKLSKLKSGAHGALTALSEQLKTQKIEIKKITTAQTQISNAMTLIMETLTKLDIKMEREFAKMTRDHIQLDTRIGRTETLGKELLNKSVETTSKSTRNWHWLMSSFPPIADEVVTDRYEGKSLVLFKTLRMTWAQANAKCELHGMELVSFDSKTELAYLEALLRSVFEDKELSDLGAFLISNIKGTQRSKVPLLQPEQSDYRGTRSAYAWVAASDLKSEGDFTWNSGKPFSSSYFGRGEPNNYLQREHCVDIGFEPSYNERTFFANDNRCERTLPVLCQKSAA